MESPSNKKSLLDKAISKNTIEKISGIENTIFKDILKKIKTNHKVI